MPLPYDGQTGWGDILNADINALQTQSNNNQTNLNNHAANNPSDPHGDRAYAQGLVNPILSGINKPNGLVQLNANGTIPASLISGSGTSVGGMYSFIFDAVATYGATAGNGADQSVAIQNALNAAGAAGGGIVWLGAGTYSMSSYVYMPSNTWLLMSEGAVLSRIPGGTNTPFLITNIQLATNSNPSTNIKISGGKLDAVGARSMTSACTPLFLVQSTRTFVEDVYFNCVFSNPAVELNGCSNTTVNLCYFDGIGTNHTFYNQTSTCPAVRINSSSSSTTYPGFGSYIYNNDVCTNCRIVNSNTISTSYYNGCFGALVGSDLTSGYQHSNIFVTGCSTEYSSALGNAVYPNGSWSAYSDTANLFI